MVAAAKLRRAQEAVDRGAPVRRRRSASCSRRRAARLDADAAPAPAPRADAEARDRSSCSRRDRGLCGGFNTNAHRARPSASSPTHERHEVVARRPSAARATTTSAGAGRRSSSARAPIRGARPSRSRASSSARVGRATSSTRSVDAVYLALHRVPVSASRRCRPFERLLPIDAPKTAAADTRRLHLRAGSRRRSSSGCCRSYVEVAGLPRAARVGRVRARRAHDRDGQRDAATRAT